MQAFLWGILQEGGSNREAGEIKNVKVMTFFRRQVIICDFASRGSAQSNCYQMELSGPHAPNNKKTKALQEKSASLCFLSKYCKY